MFGIRIQFGEIVMVEMTTVFKKTIRPILIMSKLFGLINISYVLEPAGLLVRNTNSYYSFLEISRMCALLISTLLVYHSGTPFLLLILLIKFWLVIITARIAETPLVKYVKYNSHSSCIFYHSTVLFFVHVIGVFEYLVNINEKSNNIMFPF